ncbi:MAG: hypothetical protein M3498_19200 [Deinococcota bacterium]|nr:hypothetical protein [Deinococcota bacterium]
MSHFIQTKAARSASPSVTTLQVPSVESVTPTRLLEREGPGADDYLLKPIAAKALARYLELYSPSENGPDPLRL